jgi:hypothetical protein
MLEEQMDETIKAVAEAIAKTVPTEKVYDDVAHGPLAELGKAATDVARVARLLLAPGVTRVR